MWRRTGAIFRVPRSGRSPNSSAVGSASGTACGTSPLKSAEGFALDPRLARDTVPLGRGELSLLLLMNDARYPWFILVPERADVRELHELAPADQHMLLRESTALAGVLSQLFQPTALNVAKLGNLVPQLHIHHIARFEGDPAWPGPVWGQGPAQAYSADALSALRARLAPALAPHYKAG
ncbi:HIT domain-containing protein [Ectothiorhodospiraceae bacterium 2226]|nr:HIT domain-containing protein [Ectothiorhodospiraceae bacterium 2226]